MRAAAHAPRHVHTHTCTAPSDSASRTPEAHPRTTPLPSPRATPGILVSGALSSCLGPHAGQHADDAIGSRAAVSSMAASSHMWSPKAKLIKIKFNEEFGASVALATRGWQLQFSCGAFPPLREVLLGGSAPASAKLCQPCDLRQPPHLSYASVSPPMKRGS